MPSEGEHDSTNPRVVTAVDLLWNADLKGADTELQDCLLENPEDSHAALHYAQVAWLRASLSEKEEDAKEAFDRLDQCALTCKSSNNKREDYFRKSVVAECVLLNSLLSLRLGNYISGAFKLRKGWKQFNSLILNKTDFHFATPETQQRILFVVAAFNFFVSIIPPTLRFLVSAIGFEANRQSGKTQLLRCFHSQSSISPLAGVLVLWIEAFFIEDLDRASAVFNECIEMYPNNILNLYLGGYLHRQRFEVDKALLLFERAQEASFDFHQFKLACNYEMGDCYWKLMNWQRAADILLEFLTENKSKSFRCFGAYQLGISLCFLGDESNARIWFKKSQEWTRKYFSFDAFAARKSKEYCSSSAFMISGVEKEFIKCGNLRKQGKQVEALQILNDLNLREESDNADPEQLAYYYYMSGRLLKETGSIEESLPLFTKCISLQKIVKREKYTIPHSLMEAADVHLRLGHKNEAIQLLQAAKKWKSYDFDKPNLRRIMRLLDQANDDSYSVSSSFSANE